MAETDPSSEVLWLLLYTPASILLLTGAALLGWSLNQFGQGRHHIDQCADRLSNDGSGFIGNPDFYGLGIRIGLYAQWIAQHLANYYSNYEKAQDMFAAVFAFDIGLGVALLLQTFSDACVFDVEIYIVLFLIWGSSLVLLPLFSLLTRQVNGKSPKTDALVEFLWGNVSLKDLTKGLDSSNDEQASFHSRGLGFFAEALITLAAVYSIWFYVRQIHAPAVDFIPVPGQGYFFLFARISTTNVAANGWFAALSGLALALCARYIILLALGIYGVIIFIWSTIRSDFQSISTASRNLGEQVTKYRPSTIAELKLLEQAKELELYSERRLSNSNQGHVPSWNWIFHAKKALDCLREGVWLVYTIIAVELTIHWNHIDAINEVTSTGQVIALVVGLSNFCVVTWNLMKPHLNDKNISRIIAFVLRCFGYQAASQKIALRRVEPSLALHEVAEHMREHLQDGTQNPKGIQTRSEEAMVSSDTV